MVSVYNPPSGPVLGIKVKFCSTVNKPSIEAFIELVDKDIDIEVENGNKQDNGKREWEILKTMLNK